MDTFDVAIVGAGPAGSASAVHLARRGWRVVLVDKAAFPREKPCAEYLSPACEPLLEALGALDTLAATSPARLRGFHIFAPDGSTVRGDFAANSGPGGKPIFTTGLAIPRLRLDATLLGVARAAGVTVRERWRLNTLSRTYEITTLVGGESESLQARLVIAADGVHSVVARRLGLHVPGRLRKIGLVAHIRGIAGLADYGEVHVAGRRYVGLAPLESAGDLCNVAMVVDETRDGYFLAGQPQAFLLAALRTFPALRGRLDDVTVVRPTLTTSRLDVRAQAISSDGLLLVGDAAGYYDPLTGEGIYHALRSAELAVEVAHDALTAGCVGAAALEPYGRRHREAFQGKRTIEHIFQLAVGFPPLMDHFVRQMRRHPGMADTVVAVTGDFLPATDVLNAGFLSKMLV